MKANEAPEKLYISSKQRPDKEIFYGVCTKVEDDDIEYIRTDAFIEKTTSFILKYAVDSNPYGLSIQAVNKIIDDLKKYMKGE